jgi:hypothetical protein
MAVRMGLEAVALYKSPRVEVTLSNGKLVIMRAGTQQSCLTVLVFLLTFIQGLLLSSVTAVYQEIWISLDSRI